MGNFDKAFDLLIGAMRVDTNNPADTGGETNWGITRTVAVDNGYSGSMKLMPKENSKDLQKYVLG